LNAISKGSTRSRPTDACAEAISMLGAAGKFGEDAAHAVRQATPKKSAARNVNNGESFLKEQPLRYRDRCLDPCKSLGPDAYRAGNGQNAAKSAILITLSGGAHCAYIASS
jgi:hypothetical protein